MFWLILSNPLVLLGVVFTISPVVIHLLARRSAARAEFPSLRFLRATTERTARRRRFEEMLLMLLRMLILAALTLLVLPDGLLRNRFFGAKKVGAVVIYDDSLSAGRERVQPLLQTALNNTLNSFENSPWKLVNNCVPDGGKTYRRFRVHSTQEIQAALRETAMTGMAGDLGAQVAAAAEFLRTAGTASPEIHVLTDGQRREWGTLSAPPLEGLRIFVYAPELPAEENFALERLELRARAPLTGEKAYWRGRIKNYAARRMRGTLAVFADGAVADKAALDLGAGAESESEGELTLPAAAGTSGFVQISGDTFPGDNRRFFALPVRPQLDILLLVPPAANGAAGISYLPAFYLRSALAPAAGFPVRPQVADFGGLPGMDLTPYAAVFVLEAADFVPAAVRKLRAYVARGGTLVLMPGIGSDAAKWNAALGSTGGDGGSLLPAVLAPAVTPKTPANDLLPAAADEELLAPLGKKARELLRRAGIKKYFPLTLAAGSSSAASAAPPAEKSESASTKGGENITYAGRAVVNLPDGTPFIAVRRCGAGLTILWGAPPRREWCALPLRPVFVPLLHAQLWAGRNVRAADIECGEPLPIAAPEIPATVDATVTLPDGREVSLQIPGASAAAPALFRDTWQCGIYKVAATAPEKTLHQFAVNAAAAESDLTPITAAELREKLSPLGEFYWAGNLPDWERQRTEARKDFDLSAALAFLLLGLLLAEGVYSWQRSRARGLL